MSRPCCNPAHTSGPSSHVPDATYMATRTKSGTSVQLLYPVCDICAGILDHITNWQLDIQELAEWLDEQLSDDDRRHNERLEWGDLEYDRMKDEGLL